MKSVSWWSANDLRDVLKTANAWQPDGRLAACSFDLVLDPVPRVPKHASRSAADFALFWSFRRDGTRWRLERIRPAAEADELLDVLNELSADRYREFQRVAPPAVLDHVTSVESS